MSVELYWSSQRPRLVVRGQTRYQPPHRRCSLTQGVIFWGGWWLRRVLNTVQYQLMVLRRDIQKKGGGSSAGGSGQFGNSTGVFDIWFFFFLAWNYRHFVPERCRYFITTKKNHDEEFWFLKLWKYYVADQDNREFDPDGGVVLLFNSIIYEK